jgi:hypothetical protein
MAGFDKLKNYLNDTKSSNHDSKSIGSNSFMKFFNKSSNESQNLDQLSNSETDSWFKEADTDPCCPKLV